MADNIDNSNGRNFIERAYPNDLRRQIEIILGDFGAAVVAIQRLPADPSRWVDRIIDVIEQHHD